MILAHSNNVFFAVTRGQDLSTTVEKRFIFGCETVFSCATNEREKNQDWGTSAAKVPELLSGTGMVLGL